MCLAIPGQVVGIVDEDKRLARVSVTGVQRTVNIALLDGSIPPVAPGDWVLVHVGFAMSRIDEADAMATLALLQELGSEYELEIEEFKASSIQ
ncbi:MAG: HypC/HybG/HupF family hydrogenase formation chaperone [Gemmatimonadaceae bacterium]|nr:HypC/HybG/HupF family hydrogenase formation chaperone [Gemmatimonadaceae bacterium]